MTLSAEPIARQCIGHDGMDQELVILTLNEFEGKDQLFNRPPHRSRHPERSAAESKASDTVHLATTSRPFRATDLARNRYPARHVRYHTMNLQWRER